MKKVPIRNFTTVVGYLTEPVLVTNGNETIGVFNPMSLGQAQPMTLEDVTTKEVRKAIEPDRVKVDQGKLTKGLGEIPGKKEDDPFKRFSPAPKK